MMRALLLALLCAFPMVAQQQPLSSPTPDAWRGAQDLDDLIIGSPRMEGGRVVLDFYTPDGRIAFSHTGDTKSAPDFAAKWSDAKGVVHSVTTDCDQYRNPEVCARAHQRYVDALQLLYPPVKGEDEEGK